jgi:hypothetical protein
VTKAKLLALFSLLVCGSVLQAQQKPDAPQPPRTLFKSVYIGMP